MLEYLNVVTSSVRKGKGKSVPLQAWSGPEGCRKLRFPDYMTTAQDGVQVVSLTHRPHLPPRKSSWYSFLLEAESTPGPYCERKDFMSMKYSNDTSWDRTSDLPICSTAPSPLCHCGSPLFSVYRIYIPTVKGPGREINHSPPSSAKVKNEWIYEPSPSVSLHVVGRENFNFYDTDTRNP